MHGNTTMKFKWIDSQTTIFLQYMKVLYYKLHYKEWLKTMDSISYVCYSSIESIVVNHPVYQFM